jgi:hypothetical protein
MGLLARIVQPFPMVVPVPLAGPTTFGGSVNKMVKCFWCGAENERHQETCCVCHRKLQWTTFFKGVLRPSAGCLVGAHQKTISPKPTVRLRMAS